MATRQTRQLGFAELELVADERRSGRAPAQHAVFERDAETQLVSPVGNSHYDSMQTRVNRRFNDFYQLDVNYTWSKSITTAGIPDSDNGLRIDIPEYYHLNRSLSNFDRTHNLQITNLIELPFGKGRKCPSDGGVLSPVVGGWQVNNIISLLSGDPFSVTATGRRSTRPQATSAPTWSRARSRSPAASGAGDLVRPDRLRPGDAAAIRHGRVNLLRGPGFANWDFGLFRHFRITEKLTLQFRVESFNFTNTPKFNNPTGDITNANFARITGARGDQRQFRFGLRLGF